MQVNTNKPTNMFELRSMTSKHKVRGGVFGKGRYLLGRSESCDLVVSHDAVSAIHAVMEISEDKATIYDMNSTNGTYVNGDKVVAKEVRIGDRFSLADVDFVLDRYVPGTSLPPVLDALEPAFGEASVKLPPVPEEIGKVLPKAAPQVSQQMPSIVYPLAADPKAEFSEYIFEDKEQLYPIFKYEASRQAVEVIILFRDSIFSIDYLPESKNTYFMTGEFQRNNELEFPYFRESDKFPFVDVRAHSAVVHTLPAFGLFHLSDKKKDQHIGGSVELSGQDLVRLQNGDIQIFVRHVNAPPKVAPAPILKRDSEFQKYLFSFLFVVLLITVGFNVVEVPEDVEKKELAPERIATILLKRPISLPKNTAVEKTINLPKAVPKSPVNMVTKEVPKEPQPKVEKPDVITTKDQTKQPDPGSKTAPEKRVVKQGTEPVKTPTNKIAAPPKSTGAGSKAPVPYSQVGPKSVGPVEVFKSADFSSSINTLVAKGGSLSGVTTKGASGAIGDFKGIGTSGVAGGTGNVKTADLITNQGSLVGATTGPLGESKGAGGLSAKRAIYTAGIPSETVVLGSMDPDIIRRILLEHLPQFRFCYQKELERSGEEATGTIKLDFIIGASGHVSQAGVEGKSSLPTDVKKCVVSVLRGISFPEPMGGGTVEVKQPMNFYPKKI